MNGAQIYLYTAMLLVLGYVIVGGAFLVGYRCGRVSAMVQRRG